MSISLPLQTSEQLRQYNIPADVESKDYLEDSWYWGNVIHDCPST